MNCQRELIANGHIFIACPPLYRVTTKGKDAADVYLYDQVRTHTRTPAWMSKRPCIQAGQCAPLSPLTARYARPPARKYNTAAPRPCPCPS